MSFFVIQVALPVPLASLFDYLPNNQTMPEDYPKGVRVKVTFAGRTLIGIVISIQHTSEVPKAKLKPIIQCLDAKPILGSTQFTLGAWISRYYHAPIGEVLSLMLPTALRKGELLNAAHSRIWQRQCERFNGKLGSKQALLWQCFTRQPSWTHKSLTEQGFSLQQLRGLQSKQLICEQFTLPAPDNPYAKQAQISNTPNEAQQQIIQQINQHTGFCVNLLEGITGSGKTEVYLHCIAHCLAQGKKALILVPEIGLTPQTIRRFQQRFKVGIALIHSGLNERQRLVAWQQIQGEQAQILIGTRSAVFTPIAKLGLIILDEEHDASFKQQEGIRYHARNVALVLAQQLRIPVILGSATPALETLHNALTGKYRHFKLLKRAGNARLPNMNVQPLFNVVSHCGLADTLLSRIEAHLKARQQVLVFINRRGFAPILHCQNCNWQANCPDCDARLSLHQNPALLLCHHCEHRSGIPKRCPHCHSYDIQALGQGTERLEDYLQDQFKHTQVKRIDSDNMGSKEAFGNLLDELNQGEPCILIGTQMLAKGHHFPYVTLVIMLETDAGLFSSDFRGMEISAQLITQVSGRAGRGTQAGEVWLQTYYPEHPHLLTLLQQGYHSLAHHLLAQRQRLNLPPYAHLACVRLLANEPESAKQLGEQLRAYAQSLQQNTPLEQQVQLLGPFPALMNKRAGRYRFNVLLNAKKRTQLHPLLHALVQFLQQRNKQHQVQWHLDVDPIETQ